MQAALADLKARGVTVVLIAHRQGLLAGIDKILALRDGAMALFGPRDMALQHIARAAREGAAQTITPLTAVSP